MDAKIYRVKQNSNVLAEFFCGGLWSGDKPMSKYELLSELKDVDKQDNYKEAYDENYDEIQGPLDCLCYIVPLQATDVVVLTNTTWEGTYFCRTFGWSVLDGSKFNIESDDFVSSIAIKDML